MWQKLKLSITKLTSWISGQKIHESIYYFNTQSASVVHELRLSMTSKTILFLCANDDAHLQKSTNISQQLWVRGSHAGAALLCASWQEQDKTLPVVVTRQLTRRWHLEGLHHACKKHIHVFNLFFFFCSILQWVARPKANTAAAGEKPLLLLWDTQAI